MKFTGDSSIESKPLLGASVNRRSDIAINEEIEIELSHIFTQFDD